MTKSHRIVVSSENNPYAAWQTKLFYFSCVSRLNHSPLIVVHETEKRWHPDFLELVKFGATVRSAPSFRVTAHGDDYQGRNTAGTLLHSAGICAGRDEFIVLCDPDLIFLRQPSFPETLGGDYSAIMNYDKDEVRLAAQRIGVTQEVIDAQHEELRCSVPYVIPVTDAQELARGWLEAVDAFPPRHWEDMMYAFGLAVMKLGLKPTLTHMVDIDYWQYASPTGDVIHYSYGDHRWNKRHFFSDEDAPRVWEPTVQAPKGTILGEIFSQISEARHFYRDPYF